MTRSAMEKKDPILISSSSELFSMKETVLLKTINHELKKGASPIKNRRIIHMIISFSYHQKKLRNLTDPIMSWTSAPYWTLTNSLSQSFRVNTNVTSFGLTSLEALSIGLLIGKRVTLNNFTGKNERSGSYFKISHFHVKQH